MAQKNLERGPSLNLDHLNSSEVMRNLNSVIRPYEAVVERPPAEMREVKATWLRRIVQRTQATKIFRR